MPGREASAGRGQRIDNATHRPTTQAGVAGHDSEQRMGSEDTAQQPGGGARIAHVKDIGRFGQAADTAAGDPPCPVLIARHLGPERSHGASRA